MFALYPRLHAMGVPGYETNPDTVQLLPERLEAPFTWKNPRRVFVNSMSDLFHPDVDYDFVSKVFSVMDATPSHVYQVLTKRPGRAHWWWVEHGRNEYQQWPANVWIGTSVENQKYAARLSVLSRIPAGTRFVSAEPLLEELDLSSWLRNGTLQWVIAGGESGPRARPMALDWVRRLRDQSKSAGVAFFLKQLGGKRGKRSGGEAVLDGETWTEFPRLAEDGRCVVAT